MRPRGPYPLLLALFVLLLTVQGARLFWAVVTPVGPIGDWHPALATIMPAPQRLALFSSFDPFFRGGAADGGTVAVTNLNLTLFGVRVNEATNGGSAIIAGPDGVQQVFLVGEEVVPGVRLVGVAFDQVTLEHGGTKESLFLDQAGAPVAATPVGTVAPTVAPTQPVPSAPPQGVPSATPTPSAALTPSALQQGVGVAPRLQGSRWTGLVVSPRGDGRAFAAAGLRPGDVIVSVNGRPISSSAELTQQLRPGARVSLSVERAGSTVPVALELSR